MAVGRVHHWKHGWIPLDDVARSEKYGSHQRALLAATALLAKKQAVEPTVTQELSGLAKQTGGTMVGLEFRLKSKESLARKLQTKAEQRGTAPEAEAAKVGDVLRYTMSFQPGEYTAGVKQAMATLRSKGYRVHAENHWPQDPIYKGINADVISPSGEGFELQFHTPQSHDLKEAQHIQDYEVMRNPRQPAAARSAAYQRMVENWKNVTIPPAVSGVEQVVEPKSVTF